MIPCCHDFCMKTKQSPSKTSAAPQGPRAVNLDPFVAGQKAFERQLPKLLRQYREQFVALLEGRVVDHDADDEALAARMFARFGDAPFYIAHVTQRPRIYDLPSPEVEF